MKYTHKTYTMTERYRCLIDRQYPHYKDTYTKVLFDPDGPMIRSAPDESFFRKLIRITYKSENALKIVSGYSDFSNMKFDRDFDPNANNEIFENEELAKKSYEKSFEHLANGSITCKRCKKNFVVREYGNARAADEMSTIYYICKTPNCGYKWRG